MMTQNAVCLFVHRCRSCSKPRCGSGACKNRNSIERIVGLQTTALTKCLQTLYLYENAIVQKEMLGMEINDVITGWERGQMRIWRDLMVKNGSAENCAAGWTPFSGVQRRLGVSATAAAWCCDTFWMTPEHGTPPSFVCWVCTVVACAQRQAGLHVWEEAWWTVECIKLLLFALFPCSCFLKRLVQTILFQVQRLSTNPL